MANNPSPAPIEKKSNLWLIIIVIVILIALLWPVLRRGKTPTTVTPTNGEELATTSEEVTPASEETSLVPGTVAPAATNNQITPAVSNPVSTPAPTSLALKVFFGNQARNPKTWQCQTVYPVIRTVANTSAVARAALTELLKGLRPADSAAKFFTSLNPGVAIKQLTIANGIARVDFGQPLMPSGGSVCLKDGIRAQITETLKQFPTVRSVIISTNGVLF